MFRSQLNINNSSWDRRWLSFSLPSNFCLTVFLFVYKSNSRRSVPLPPPKHGSRSPFEAAFQWMWTGGWVQFSFLYATADAAISPSASSRSWAGCHIRLPRSLPLKAFMLGSRRFEPGSIDYMCFGPAAYMRSATQAKSTYCKQTRCPFTLSHLDYY